MLKNTDNITDEMLEALRWPKLSEKDDVEYEDDLEPFDIEGNR